MSVRVDSSSWITGAIVVGDPGLGVKAELIPSSGENGAGYAYASLDFPADNGKEVCGRITAWPTNGTLTAFEDTGFEYTGSSDAFAFQLYVDGVAVGSSQTVSITVGQSVVTARPVAQSSTVNAPSIVQAHVLTARTVAHGSTVTRPGLNQTHTVTARAVAQGSTVNLGEVLISLAGAASTQANTGSAGAIAQSINLQGSNAIQVNAAWAAAIVQAHHLSGAASQQANQGAAGQITLGDLPVVEEVLGTGRLRVGPADMVLASQRIGTSSLPGTGPRIGTTILSTRRPGRMTI